MLACTCLGADAQLQVKPGGQGPAGMTAEILNIPATSTHIVLVAPSCYITIVNLSATNILYFNPVSPATTSDFPIAPYTAYSYSGTELTDFYVIGSSSGDTYGVIAH